MTSRRVYVDYLRDMLDAAEKAEGFLGTLSFEEFEKNDEKVFAVVRALEIIGEAAKQVPLSVQEQHAEAPWRAMAGMRDVLIHNYFGINLRRTITAILQDLA